MIAQLGLASAARTQLHTHVLVSIHTCTTDTHYTADMLKKLMFDTKKFDKKNT